MVSVMEWALEIICYLKTPRSILRQARRERMEILGLLEVSLSNRLLR